MNAIDHISTLSSVSWSGWTMLMLLLTAVLAEWAQPGIVTQTVTSMTAEAGRRVYHHAPTNAYGQVLIALFRIGTMAMALCMCVPTATIRFPHYLLVCGMVTAMMLVKMLCNILLDYTFSISHGSPVYEQYGNLVTMTMTVVYPSLLILNRVGTPQVNRWVIGILAAVMMVLWLISCIRSFVTTPRALIYSIVYFLTLEVLPLVILIVSTVLLIQNV